MKINMTKHTYNIITATIQNAVVDSKEFIDMYPDSKYADQYKEHVTELAKTLDILKKEVNKNEN